MAMTREDVKAIFPEATDAQISSVLNNYHKDIQAERSIADGLRNAARQAETTQQANADLADRFEQMQKSFNDMVAENAKLRNRNTAVAAFTSAGVPSEQYEKLLDLVVSDDEQRTKDVTASLIAVISATSESAKATAKQELLSKTPAPAQGTPPAPPATPEADYQKALQSGNVLDIIRASDAMAAAQNKA